MVEQRFRAEGVTVLTGHRAVEFIVEDGRKTLVCERDGASLRIEFDAVLCAVGRIANTAGYGLEELGIGLTRARTVETNEYLQTIYPNIYACGDVAGPYQFTHTASHQAWYAATNALFGRWKLSRADYSVIPWATFTDPEVARVGLNETEARDKGVPHEVTTYHLDDLDRVVVGGERRLGLARDEELGDQPAVETPDDVAIGEPILRRDRDCPALGRCRINSDGEQRVRHNVRGCMSRRAAGALPPVARRPAHL